MLTDFVVNAYFWPVVAGGVLLLVVGVAGRQAGTNGREPATDRGRLGLGYLGGVAAIALYAALETYRLGLEKVERGQVTPDVLRESLSGWIWFVSLMLIPIAIFFMTVFGLPLFALISRYGWGSLVGVLALAAAFTLAFAGYFYLVPYNLWCGAHPDLCMARTLVDVGIPAVLVALGFALGARLPLLKAGGRP